MKALSIRQPYAWLIVNGLKPLENRSWYTDLRGTILIHAPKQPALTKNEYKKLRQAVYEDFGIWMPANLESLPYGGIVGKVDLVDCVDHVTDDADLIWHEPGSYAFVFANPQKLPFTPMPGQLKFFEVHSRLLRQ